jgi:hypothetical protein
MPPAALASAICQAAQGRSTPALSGLASGGAARRVRELLGEAPVPRSRRDLVLRALVAGVVMSTLTVGSALPATTAAAAQHRSDVAGKRHC